jgi:hypothetical protein
MKSPPQTVPRSKSEALEAIKSTIANKLYRLTHYYKIRSTKAGALMPFQFNDIQKHIYETFQGQKPIRQFYLKFRQGGVSTFWLLWWLDETIFKANTVTGVLAHKWESLHHLWSIVDVAWKNFPDQLRPPKAEISKSRLHFPSIQSEIFISLSIRSIGVNNLHISEWCFCDSQEVEATLGACGTRCNITGESTGNGIGNSGYLAYQDAKNGLTEFKAHFYPWFIDSTYSVEPVVPIIRTSDEKRLINRAQKDYGIILTDAQLLWRRQKKQGMEKLFAQEFPSNDEEAFIATGGRFFDSAKMMALLEEAREWGRAHTPIKSTPDWEQWEEPHPKSTYVAGADVAEGGGSGDWSVLVVLNATKGTMAFRYRAQVGIDVFYRICDQWGRYFRNAWLAVEKNNHGHAVIQGLIENCLYPNLYYRVKPKRYKEPTQTIFDPSDRLHRAGWLTDATTKPMMMDALKKAIEGGTDTDVEHFEPDFSVPDVLLIQELLTFVEISGKLEAETGKHDDIVVACAIANQLYQEMRLHTGKDLGILLGKNREISTGTETIAGKLATPRGR